MKVFNEISKEYEAKDKMLEEIKDLSSYPEHLGLKVYLVYANKKYL